MNMPSATVDPAHPSRLCLTFVRALSRGDLESASGCFARDGCLITPDATAIHGRERIRPVLAQLIARRTEIEVELSSAITAGEFVLVQEQWRLRAAGVEGSLVGQTLHPTLAMGRVEGQWKLVIAAPWGWGQTGH